MNPYLPFFKNQDGVRGGSGFFVWVDKDGNFVQNIAGMSRDVSCIYPGFSPILLFTEA